MSENTPPSGQELLTRDEAAAIAQSRAMESLVTALTPMVQQVMDGTRAAKRDDNDHEIRAIQLEAAERFHKRMYPLVWMGALVVTAVIGGACYVGRWEIATHLLTAILAWASGYFLKRPRDRDAPDE